MPVAVVEQTPYFVILGTPPHLLLGHGRRLTCLLPTRLNTHKESKTIEAQPKLIIIGSMGCLRVVPRIEARYFLSPRN